MDEKARLDSLRERKLTIEDIDREMDRALYAVAAGQVDYALRVLEGRRKDHAEFMFELGKVTARIEDIEHRVQEQDERGREALVVEDWQRRAPVVPEDMKWLLEPEHDSRNSSHEGEERVPQDTREPQDDFDWWKR